MFYRVSSSENRTLKRIDDISVKDDSPTTGYFNRHFSKPVKMLGGTSLVQFSVTPEQFEEYVNFTYASEDFKFSGGSCVLHSLFSLGLRNSTQVKADAERMYTKSMIKGGGINRKKTARYLAKIAGLPRGSIIVVRGHNDHYVLDDVWKEEEWDDLWKEEEEEEEEEEEMFYIDIERYFNKQLVNNHATIFSVHYFNKTKNKTGAHALVAYKRNNKVEFFDPQKDKENAGRSTVKDCMSTYGDLVFNNFYVYVHSTPLEKDILIDDDRSCRIPFGNSPNDSPDSPLDKLQWHAEIAPHQFR